MIWVVSILTIFFGLGATAEKDKDNKKIYAAVTIGGMIALAIMSGL